jgi:hypothetical protein
VLLTGSTTRSLGPPTRDASTYHAAIRKVEAGATDTDLGSALRVIRPMLARHQQGSRVELDFITDNHQRSWREGAIAVFQKDLNIPLRVRIVDVGVISPQNAWIADARLIAATKPIARRFVRVQIGCIGDAGQSRTLRLSGISGLPEISRTVQLDPAKLAQIDLELPPTFDAKGQIARVAIEPGDALPDDDSYFLNLDPHGATKVLIVESDSTRSESTRAGFYLRAALAALSSLDARALDVVTKTSDAIDASDVEHADAVFLADIPHLSDANLAALEARVKSGAGLAIFLGPDVEPTFYNTKLYQPQTPSDGLLAFPLKSIVDAPRQRLDSLTNIDWSHPLLAPLYDPVLGDLAQTSFRSHYEFDSNTQAAVVLASIDGRAPAIIDRTLGAGRVVLFNTTANDAWSDLPRRKSFVPLVDRLLSYLAGGAGGARGSFEVGEPISLPLGNVKSGASVTVTSPTGKKLTPILEMQAGKTVMRLDDVREAGIYRVDAAGEAHTFVVQVGRGDSVLTPIDPAILKKWWEPANVEIVAPDTAARLPGVSDKRVALWPWLVALACLVFLAEMYFVHRLCPRMNPGVVAPVVPRHGMFGPKREPEEEEVAV